jgi:hypothetical protein
MWKRRVFQYGLVVIPFFGITQVGTAQGSVSVSASGDHSFDGPLSCANSASGANVSVDLSGCLPQGSGGYNGTHAPPTSALAEAGIPGITGVEGAATIQGTGRLDLFDLAGHTDVSASARWDDELSWTGGNVASVGVTFGISGSAFQSPNTSQAYLTGAGNSAEAAIGLAFGSGSQTGSQSWTGVTVADVAALEGVPFETSAGAIAYVHDNDIVTQTVFQEFSVTGTSMPLFWSTYMTGESAIGQVLSGEDNNAFSYGRAVGGLAGVRFFDDQHADITEQVQFQFTNGAEFAFSSVPEPSTIALLGTGLVGLLPMVRRRRRS